MKIIAIESSGLVASAAIVDEDRMIAEYTMNNRKTHSQTLLPMIDEIMRAAEIKPEDVDAVAISRGPGSFTGLRIGSATAKGMAFALDKPIVEVPTLEALAFNLTGTGDSLICPIMDAKRNEVYTAVYSSAADNGGYPVPVLEERAIPVDELIAFLNGQGRSVIFTGDAVPVYRQQLEQKLSVPFMFAPIHMAGQRAGAVGALAVRYYKEGRAIPSGDHVPVYLRLSQAEREAARKKEQG